MTINVSDLYSEPVIVGTTQELSDALDGLTGAVVGLKFVPRDRQVIIDRTEGTFKIGDGTTAYDDLTALPGGGTSDALPLADPTGFTTEEIDNPVTGTGTMTVAVFPADTAVYAWKLEGDAFPRMFWTSDPSDGIYIGDGTFDPWLDGGANMGLYMAGDAPKFQFNGLRSTGDIEAVTGVVFAAPSGDHFRLTVSDAGEAVFTPLA